MAAGVPSQPAPAHAEENPSGFIAVMTLQEKKNIYMRGFFLFQVLAFELLKCTKPDDYKEP